MNEINIFTDTPIESILSYVEEKITNYHANYIILSFQNDIRDIDRIAIVKIIKEYFNIFIIFKTDIPKHRHRIEEYFSYGVHGIYFDVDVVEYSKKEFDIFFFTKDLFTKGWVFANTLRDKRMIEELLAIQIIPILSTYDNEFINYIKSHESFNKISSNLIKSIPVLDKKKYHYSLAEKIKMKMLLESLNLRQKLMLKKVDESFASSGL